MFPDSVIQEVAEKNDIYDVVSKYVHLKKAGASYIGLCPFHNEKTPSFSVSVQRGIYKCFGCGEGGDVINFTMKIENLSFADAVKKLAADANILLPEVKYKDNKSSETRKESKQRVLSVNLCAADFFYENLKKSDIAVNYLKKRGISGAEAKYFKLGYAPDSWNKLYDYLLTKDFTETDIFNAGLVKKHESGRYYDMFRNRLIIPIFNGADEIIGFGGRVFDDSKPKYLNSPETIVFNKSRNLYGINIAKKSRAPFVMLTEGYMDAMALIKNGYTNAVATLGTALTAYQANMLAKMFSEIVICYDSDNAGCIARNKAITILREYDVKISVIDMGDKKDPDEYIRAYGKTRFDNVLKNRKADMVYITEYFKSGYNLNNPQETVGYISKVIEYIKLIKSSVEQDIYINMLSRITKVSANAIYAQLGIAKAKSVTPKSEKQSVDPVILQLKTVRRNNGAALKNAEGLLLSLLTFNKQVYERHKGELKREMFSTEIYAEYFDYMQLCYERAGEVNVHKTLASFAGNGENEIAGILSLDNKSENAEKAYCDYTKVINTLTRKIKASEFIKEGADAKKINELLKNK